MVVHTRYSDNCKINIYTMAYRVLIIFASKIPKPTKSCNLKFTKRKTKFLSFVVSLLKSKYKVIKHAVHAELAANFDQSLDSSAKLNEICIYYNCL